MAEFNYLYVGILDIRANLLHRKQAFNCYYLRMATIIYTENLQRHIECPTQQVEGSTVAEALKNAFAENTRLKHYVLDDQNRLRKHMLVSVDGKLVSDRIYLSDAVNPNSEIYILQALSGG